MSKKIKNYKQPNQSGQTNVSEQVKDLGAKRQVIPVLIYGEKWEISLTDVAMKKWMKKVNDMKLELEETQKRLSDDEDDFAQLDDLLLRSFDTVLGDGAYQRIVKHETDSVTLIQTLVNLGNYLDSEFSKLNKKFEMQHMKQVIAAKKNSQAASPTLSPKLSAY